MSPFAIAALTVALSTTPAKRELRCSDPIPATMVDRVDSASAYPGQRFRFKTTAPVTRAGQTIPSGSQGFGYVRYAHAASHNNRNGLIVLEPRLLTVGELQLPVMWDPLEAAQYAGTPTLAEQAAGYIPLPIAGPISAALNAARVGHNITIGPGFVFHVLVLDEVGDHEPCAWIPVSTPSPKP